MIPTVNIVSNGVFPTMMGALTEQGMVRAGFVGLGLTMLASLVLLPFLGRSPRGSVPGT